jgi:hypothetical protein
MIHVSLDKADFERVILALRRVQISITREALSLIMFSSHEFSLLLKENIMTQKYGDFGSPHSEAYSKQKRRLYPATASYYWRMTDSLVSNISAQKVGALSYFTGIPSGATNSESGKEINKYAYSIEYGYSKMNIPERPLFRSSLSDYETVFYEKVGISLSKILAAWY